MTVQEAIDLIKQVPLYRYECDLEKSRQSDLFNALNVAIEALEKQIPKKPIFKDEGCIGIIKEKPQSDKWIPCSERMPEEEQEVLLQFEDNMAVGFYFVEGGRFDGTTNWYGLADNDSYTDCDSKPIAWMPLPEPYKKEGAE